MSSTKRGTTVKKDHDYYVTPLRCIRTFVEEFAKHELDLTKASIKILDPAAGGDSKHPMSYPEVIGRHVDTIDIRKDSLASRKYNYLKSIETGYKVIITNPPFYLAEDFVEKSLDEVVKNGFVVMFLRLNYFGSQRRKRFFDRCMPKYCFVDHKRASFTDNGKTDSIEYAHFVWQKGWDTKFTKLMVI